MPAVIVHYQEIALKGRNRPWFVERLVTNIRAATAGVDGVRVRALMGRIKLQHASDADWPEVRERLSRVPGVANFLRAAPAACDFDAIAETVLAELDGVEADSFRVTARRADKRFPMTSPQIERNLGGRIKAAKGWRVDLDRPALTVRVEVLAEWRGQPAFVREGRVLATTFHPELTDDTRTHAYFLKLAAGG